MFSFFDDARLTRTEELTLVVSTLRRFRDSLSRIIGAWEVFERDELRFFAIGGSDKFRQEWEENIDTVRGQISELRFLLIRLGQRLEFFNHMLDSVYTHFLLSLRYYGASLTYVADGKRISAQRKYNINATRPRYQFADKNDCGKLVSMKNKGFGFSRYNYFLGLPTTDFGHCEYFIIRSSPRSAHRVSYELCYQSSSQICRQFVIYVYMTDVG